MAKRKKQLKRNPTKKTSGTNDSVIHGSGNVFTDLGFDNAEELQVKASLTHQIHSRIKSLGLNQIQAGKLLNISQPDVSKLMRGRFTGFSTDRLIALLNLLQVDVDIVIRPLSQNGGYHSGTVRIVTEV